jgi:hypothetical protein
MVRRRHREAEAPTGLSYQKIRSKLSSERWNAKINGITNLHVPDRGEEDTDSREVFTGFTRMKIAALTLTQAEQATNSTDGRVLASGSTNAERAVDSAHIKDNALLSRMINGGKWGKADLPGDVHYGKVKAASDIDYGEGRPIPSGKVDKGYPWDDVGQKPTKFSPAKHDNKDHKKNFALAGHKHSQSIKLMSVERRKAACELRERLRSLPREPYGELRDGLLVLMALAFDDPGYSLEETLSYSAEEMVERHHEETAFGEDDRDPVTGSHVDLDTILTLKGRE